ncbi:hypothetical protein CU097_004925 [Rhizopus azygosporus]|uniref:SH3 domain-containing protein n=1 Tax=Rhizopus azygosporus TaxID=86630 RepID=A0A367J6F8_RHIAZ|nr:hypothetical protein CU097_004925 [Rhizopus azygosporus]
MKRLLWPLVLCYSILAIEVPTLRLDDIGQLGFIGDYVGISPFEDARQTESIPQNTSALYIHHNNLFTLFSTIDGSIEAYCQLDKSNYILGDTLQLTPLQQGLNGPVRALYCFNQSVYVGGEFDRPMGDSVNYGHTALWQGNKWIPLPWQGFNGPVYSIIPIEQSSSIWFAGQFNATSDGKYTNQSYQQSVDLISLATITAGNSAPNTDPSSVICSQSPWLLRGDSPGYWQASFPFPIQPSLFRLKNTNINGTGTRQFSIISLGSNDYFNLSYIDPATQQIQHCSEACLLSNTSDYQDFIVSTPLSTNGIRINIDSWYGSQGGLGGVQIFRSDTSLQPHLTSSNTNGSCSSTPEPSSTFAITGNWTETYAFGTYQNFLTSTFPASQLSSADVSVTYKPYISAQGMYNVYANTPGCVGTSNCNQRTNVELAIELTPGNQQHISLSQQNYQDQRTLIYQGIVSSSTGSFQPTITLRINPSNITQPSSDTVSIIADSIEFVRNDTYPTLSSILQFFPFNNSWSALPDQLSIGSTVRTLSAHGDTVYIGGQLANSSYSNIVSYNHQQQRLIPPSQSGLNGVVTSSVIIGSKLIVGGNFTDTQVSQNIGLNHVAIYDTEAGTWSAMNQGVNGTVTHLYATDNESIHLSGQFNYASSMPVYGNAEWSLSSNAWVPASSFVLGPVTYTIPLNSTASLYFGNIKNAQSYWAMNAASMSSSSSSWSNLISQVDPSATIRSGILWKDDSVILGGSFNLNQTQYQVVMYQQGTWQGLLQNIQGDIKTMLIIDDKLFMGGNFTGPRNMSSLGMYDLNKRSLSAVYGLYDANQRPGQVNVIRSNGQTVFVGGDFDYAGLLNCGCVCSLSIDHLQWAQVSQNSLGGTVNDMVVQNNGTIVVAGDLKVDNTPTPIAQLGNNRWTAFTASVSQPQSLLLTPDGKQYIISGRQQNTSYIGSWDGHQFTALNQSNLDPSSTIQQLLYVPTSSSTMLMAVGHMSIDNKSSSAALYDGSQWYPTVLTASADGSAGSVRQLLTTSNCCSSLPERKRYLSVPAVVLVSLGISLAILFCLVAIGLLVLFLRRRYNSPTYIPPPEWKPRDQTAMGYTTGATLLPTSVDMTDARQRRFSNTTTTLVPFSALLAAALRHNDEQPASEESPKVYYAKYPFEAKEVGELAFGANAPIVVTDMTDNVWWMGYIDDGSGNAVSGLFPSNYVTKRKPTGIE